MHFQERCSARSACRFPLCPVCDRGCVAVKYVAKGHVWTLLGAAAVANRVVAAHLLLRGQSVTLTYLVNLPTPCSVFHRETLCVTCFSGISGRMQLPLSGTCRDCRSERTNRTDAIGRRALSRDRPFFRFRHDPPSTKCERRSCGGSLP
jgi:hypothetical protein